MLLQMIASCDVETFCGGGLSFFSIVVPTAWRRQPTALGRGAFPDWSIEKVWSTLRDSWFSAKRLELATT